MQLAPNNVCGSCISVPYIAVWKMNPLSASKEQAEGFLSFSATHFYLDTHLHSFLCGVWDAIVTPPRVGPRLLLLHWCLVFPGELLSPRIFILYSQRQCQAPVAAVVISKRHRAGDSTPSLHLPYVSIQMYMFLFGS